MPSVITSAAVSQKLDADRIKHVVIGGHAMAAHGRVRNTEDVDVISVDMEEAAKSIATLHRGATVVRYAGAQNCSVLGDDGRKVADVLSYFGAAANRHAVDSAMRVDGVSMPERQAMMALKFEAMTSASRPRDKRAIDLSDLIYLVNRYHRGDSSTAAADSKVIEHLVESDSCGDSTRGAGRWRDLHRAILTDQPIAI